MYKILLLLLLIASSADAQIGRMIDRAADKIDDAATNAAATKKQKKAAKERELFISSHLQVRTFGKDSTKVLRATKETSSEYAVLIQNELEKIYIQLSTPPFDDLTTPILAVGTKIVILKEKTKDYPAEYYESEAAFYNLQNDKNQKQKQENAQKQREIALQNEKIEREKLKIQQQEASRKKKEADSLEILRITKGYHFVNAPKIYIYSKSELSNPIGEVGQASYIVIVDTVPKKGFVKIAFGDESTAFVEKNTLVDNIFKIDDKATYSYQAALKNYYETFVVYSKPQSNGKTTTTNPTYNNSTNTSVGKTEKTRVWYTGPRGGRYYLDEKGNKQYEKKK